MEPDQELFLGQRIKIKSNHLPISLFNDQMGTFVGPGEEQDTFSVRPDTALDQTFSLYPHEIRDANPPQEAPLDIRMKIPELALLPESPTPFKGINPQQV